MEAHGGSGYPESPFMKVLGTNYAPSPKEISKIRKLLHEPEKRLEILEAEIVRLQSQREELKSFIDNHHSLLSPVRRVPTDTLRDIFMRCLPDDHLPTDNICEAPLLLTSICRSWREVAISTPHLWSRIHISLRYPSQKVNDFFRSWMQIRSEGLKLWLERSGKVPLTLSLNTGDEWHRARGRYTPGDAAELQKLYADFARLLLPYASRWKSLSLDATPAVTDILGELSVGQLTLLEEFKSNGRSAGEALNILFRHSPSLRVLHLIGAPLDLPIRWGNLTEVVIYSGSSNSVTPSRGIQVLSLSSTSLRRCELQLWFPSGSDPFSCNTPVVLPYLHTLNIYIFNRPSSALSKLEHFFGAIVAPMLKAISLGEKYSHFVAEEASDRLPLLNLLQRSTCPLSSLHLDLKVAATAVVMCLQQVPSLIELKIHATHGIHAGTDVPEKMELLYPLSDFFHSLTPSSIETGAVVCPNLEIFTCTGCPPSHAASLLALAEARSVPSGDSQSQHSGVEKSLKRMTVTFNGFIEDTDTPFRLENLREKGMWIQWSSPPDGRSSLGRRCSPTLFIREESVLASRFDHIY